MWRIKLLFIVVSIFVLTKYSSGIDSQINNENTSIDITKGVLKFETGQFNLEILKSSHTIFGLHPVTEPEFDFTPNERLQARNAAGYYHLGDINFRWRPENDKDWKSYSSAASREDVMVLEPKSDNVLAVSDISGLFSGTLPLSVIRYWEKHGESVVLRFELKNNSEQKVELGSLGIPVILNNNHSGKTLDEAHNENVFYDPYIGMDAGYLQAIRLKGTGEVLLVVPCGKTPFEAWSPLLDDPTQRSNTFEGFHEWMPLTKAHAENDWKEATPWNIPSSKILNPGEIISYGLEFLLADSVRAIETTLISKNRPVAVGIPGYVLPQDVNGDLFLNYNKKVKSLRVEPEGALVFTKQKETENGWQKYDVKANTWGRARLTITYKDDLVQTINYKIIKPEAEVVADNGHFLTTKQWFEAENDTFHRSPSVITYDYEEQKQVIQDTRAWICGLGDEGGAGSWLNAIMKQLVQPDKEEINKLEEFVQKTIWGRLQVTEGREKYGVRKSLFYYEPLTMPQGTYDPNIVWGNYGGFPSWNKEGSNSVGRSYNYPHVAAAHWVMYRLARNYEGLVKQQSWDWYLINAYQTSMAMVELAPFYAEFGQMEGSVFVHILDDLKAEGFWEYARKLEGAMRVRALHWRAQDYPYGSEMPWDSTGQEEIYMWYRYFNFSNRADSTINVILAYMPTIPHWAYNGNARRYWDFLYGGKLPRVERQIHHYGSALNAIPVLHQYKLTPDDFYLLRVGYAGLMGALSNITQDGFAPAAFHSFPSTLKNDGISGDYGSGYYGYAVNTSTFLTNHEEFGWLAFGGNIEENGDELEVEITTAAKSRIYIAPLKLWMTLDAGKFKKITYNKSTKDLGIELAEANEFTPNAYLRIESFGKPVFENKLAKYTKNSRGQYVIPLPNGSLKIQ